MSYVLRVKASVIEAFTAHDGVSRAPDKKE